MRIEVTPKVPIIFCVACEKELASNRLVFNQERGIAASLCDGCLDDLECVFIKSENAPDKLLKYAEIIQLLDTEQEWCNTHPDFAQAFDPEYIKGFVKGLLQAKYIVAHLKEKQ